MKAGRGALTRQVEGSLLPEPWNLGSHPPAFTVAIATEKLQQKKSATLTEVLFFEGRVAGVVLGEMCIW